jgi:hypothetical protein
LFHNSPIRTIKTAVIYYRQGYNSRTFEELRTACDTRNI